MPHVHAVMPAHATCGRPLSKFLRNQMKRYMGDDSHGNSISGMQDMYSTIDEAVKLVVANKVDRSTEREVSFEQGAAFAKKVRSTCSRKGRRCQLCPLSPHNSSLVMRSAPAPLLQALNCQFLHEAESPSCRAQNGTLFVETSAKANVAVSQAFEELVAKVLDTPSLLQVQLAPAPISRNCRVLSCHTQHESLQHP